MGRQPMHNLVLKIAPDGTVSGRGEDCIGPFTFSGHLAPEVRLVKQYLGQHAVLYLGTNSGEGIFGTWCIPAGESSPLFDTGRFALFPVQDASAERLAVQELKPVGGG